MSERPMFEYTKAVLCRDNKVGNCPEVAVNVPGVVALRDSERPGTVVTMSPQSWAVFVEAVKAGEFDLSA